MCASLAEAMIAEGMKVLEEINLAMKFPSASLDHIFNTLHKYHLLYTPTHHIYHIHASLLNPTLMAESIFIFILRTLQMSTYVTSQMPRLIVLLRRVFVCMYTYTYISQSHTCIHHILSAWIRVIIFQDFKMIEELVRRGANETAQLVKFCHTSM